MDDTANQIGLSSSGSIQASRFEPLSFPPQPMAVHRQEDQSDFVVLISSELGAVFTFVGKVP
ncbi:hypothetical protein [Bradyrhizobium sp. WSM1417]|uniref:hypothetical protein n=1 Tax=Bradyrhizobium sp. WSM1417 TaxID=754500 RepID=UPI00056230A2|nr:hypothetical protein [Bradyrhizobium sp. WSM1417]